MLFSDADEVPMQVIQVRFPLVESYKKAHLNLSGPESERVVGSLVAARLLLMASTTSTALRAGCV